MKYENIISFLERTNSFTEFILPVEQTKYCNDYNINIFSNQHKLIFLKEYRTKSSFIHWNSNEQVCISELLNKIPQYYLNNIYFFMILNFLISEDDEDTKLLINKIEKDEFICKKYIITNINDLDRIPFLSNTSVSSEKFNFDEKFIEKVQLFNKHSDKTLNIDTIIEKYFVDYENNINYDSTDLLKIINNRGE